MGNCMSSTKTEKTSTATTKRTTQTVQRNNGAAIIKKATKSTGNTQKSFKPSKNSQGHKLTDNSTSEGDSQVLNPREAAAKAAEERKKKQSQPQGKLGNKLEQERKKSARKHLADESEKMNQMKKVNELVYD